MRRSELQLQSSRGDNDGSEIHSVTFMEEVDSLRLSLRGRKLTIAIVFVTGAGFTLFGCESLHVSKLLTSHVRYSSYDQGVMSSLLTAKQVRIRFLIIS